jgi:L-threonylcarbamoyladenylate synthase
MKLNNESVFIYPTDTVWGIGASIYSQSAQKTIASIKRTSDDKPLSIMFTDITVLYNSFNFPDVMSLSWLRSYFKLESTLAIPLKIAKISIPSWVMGKSDLVSVRCLEHPELKIIGETLKAPFITTSLNLTGEPPIINFQDAKQFQLAYAPDAEFFGDSSHNLSGRSSTIVFFRANGFEIIREGLKVEEIKKHLSLTGLVTT